MAFVDSQELEWQHATIAVLGLTIRGFRGFKYKTEEDAEHLHAGGNQAAGIQTGNEKCDGSFKFLKSEVDRLNAAARAAGYRNIAKVPYQLISAVILYKEGYNRPIQTDVISGIKFTGYEKAMEQGAKFMEVELPFLAMRINEQ